MAKYKRIDFLLVTSGYVSKVRINTILCWLWCKSLIFLIVTNGYVLNSSLFLLVIKVVEIGTDIDDDNGCDGGHGATDWIS